MNIQIIRSLVLSTILAVAAPAAAGQPACLEGDAAPGDLAAIAAVEAAADAACACQSFDGSEDATAADYRRCVFAVVREAVKAGELRAKCKARLAKAYKASTCGQPDGVAPCIEQDAGGEVRCKIRSHALCVSVPGRLERLACPDSVRCVDAADDSGDWLVGSADSGTCRPPATTTTTLEPTTTTEAPTTSTTLVEATTTTMQPEDTTTTTTIEETTTTTLEEETTTTTTSTTSTTTTTVSTTTTTLPCGTEPPTVVLRLFMSEPREEEPAPPVPPDPRTIHCPSQSNLGGGCGNRGSYTTGLDGTIPNYWDATGSYVPNACPGTTLSYHWFVYMPPALGNARYASAGITGYFLPELTIRPQSFPSLFGTEAGGDPFWRVKLVVVANQGAQPYREVWFSFDYVSHVGPEAAQACQSHPMNCTDPHYQNLKPPTEPY